MVCPSTAIKLLKRAYRLLRLAALRLLPCDGGFVFQLFRDREVCKGALIVELGDPLFARFQIQAQRTFHRHFEKAKLAVFKDARNHAAFQLAIDDDLRRLAVAVRCV